MAGDGTSDCKQDNFPTASQQWVAGDLAYTIIIMGAVARPYTSAPWLTDWQGGQTEQGDDLASKGEAHWTDKICERLEGIRKLTYS